MTTKFFPIMLRLSILITIVIHLCGYAEGQWALSAPQTIPVGKETTISLQWKGSGAEGIANSGVLWLDTVDRTNALVPETVDFINGKASFPVFYRDAIEQLLVYDSTRKALTTLTLPLSRDSISYPRISLTGYQDRPVVFANQMVTPTLTLRAGAPSTAQSALLSIQDHRGRTVVSRFISTFDLQGKLDGLRVPAAGLYEMRARFFEEPITSMPLALQREPQPIPFGVTVEQLPVVLNLGELVTTDVVAGSRVFLEHAPTTATLVAEDRMQLFVLAPHSNAIRQNKWPYVIAGANIEAIAMSKRLEVAGQLLPLLRLLGSPFTPVTVKWSDMQPSPGRFQWFEIDSILEAIRQNRSKPLLTIEGKAAWNGEYPSDSEETRKAWSDLITQLSQKYRSMIWSLQGWNRPEKIWNNSECRVGYQKVFLTTWKAFLNPGAEVYVAPPVVMGGTQGFDESFFNDVLTSETASRAGGVAIDCTPEKLDKSPEDNRLSEILQTASDYFMANGIENGKLWFTGISWPSSTNGVSEKLQANYLVRSHVIALSHNPYKIIWDGFLDKVDYAWDGSAEDHLGLLRKDLSLKPAAVAYNFLSFMASGVTAKGVTKQGKATIYSFDIPLQTNKWQGALYVAWTGSPKYRQEIKLEMTHGGGIFAMDYLGAEIPALNMDENADNSLVGTFKVPVGFEPVFIWDAGKPGSQKIPTDTE